ncbi:peptidoglycan DD-metalloendopeptidase family protein [Flagellimonas sp. HMM57]|uniref:peptidoglycan DD-metalloendopeptidase family protein n=1 Tax=unclassified Flagellimonas TaxID=2644544 RepID=UPI0013D23DE0|nr:MULTISPECIES: peptidoglycan DD-metalloendopeptidase family protein [unclassified Flagellimonas]UII75221.1 peptidoglycan DD-metalloendopeptidase family protein [Flagellimonas sp. HMM57]
MNLETLLKTQSTGAIQILDSKIPLSAYCKIDLSTTNETLKGIDITSPDLCQQYIDDILGLNNAKVAFGGYLEKRALYAKSERFLEAGQRNIHLGMDFWCKAGTKVIVPLEGKVHSFKNNDDVGNYGPTILLEHQIEGITFYTLYGHLSLESIHEIEIGAYFDRGEVLGTLGTPDINVNYAPHLHFQVILDLEGYYGDYPGVSSWNNLDFYKKNCPNPNSLLRMDF